MTTVIINEPGLQQHRIPVGPSSIVQLAKHDSGANVWHALWVDGVAYDLVQIAHIFGRPEHVVAMQRVVNKVKTAIVMEQPQ
jgi:hypothetical protein